MDWLPIERDRYQAAGAHFAEAWDRMADVFVPPSLEVLRYGHTQAHTARGRIVPLSEYVGWLIEWADLRPHSDLKGAP